MAISKDTFLEKERMQLKVNPRKVGVGLKRRGSWIIIRGGAPLRRRRLTFAQIQKKIPELRSELQLNQLLVVPLPQQGPRGEEDLMARASASREQLTEESRKA